MDSSQQGSIQSLSGLGSVQPRRFKFTHRLIDGLPPDESDAPSREAEYSDTEISRLKCLVGKGDGKKKFLLRYLWQSRKRAISINHWPEIDVTTAERLPPK